MSEVLSEIQAGYVQRVQMALEPRGKPLESIARPKATRTYTGAALARRQAWGRQWGGILSAVSHQLRDED